MHGGVDLAEWLDLVAAPGGAEDLMPGAGELTAMQSQIRYPVSAKGIPLFVLSALSQEAEQQQRHYDRIASAYMANLSYPHTQEYMAYLDQVLMDTIGTGNLGTVAELCCGHGEALSLRDLHFDRYIGIDVSEKMLERGLAAAGNRNVLFAQGDATRTPIKSACIDTMLMLGGIHHVPDRAALFREIRRVLKPTGRVVFREPVSDFVVWKAIRWIVYRMSPMLDQSTERPLTYEETEPVLREAGLSLTRYKTCGFLGFCLFMNSDVLVFNRLFRYVPGIRAMTQAFARFDDSVLRLPALSRAGLQVVGEARVAAQD